MKILYGVQATGNGHISRARVIAPILRRHGVDVRFLFTGRSWDHLFDMEVFGDFEWRRGLTFATHAGRVQYARTAFNNDLARFVRDVMALDLSVYDLVVTDFEPVTAWAAKYQGVKSVGVGHQYAFNHAIPRTGDDILARNVMKYFAPATIGLGLHWHHFGQPILPPIIETPKDPEQVREDKIIVYLPFEEVDAIVQLLMRFGSHQFHVYSSSPCSHKPDHIQVRPLSRIGFQDDFRDCGGVICNAGFELASEALQMGKKLLVKPLRSQMEQLSNALALEQIQLASVMPDLDEASVAYWLQNGIAHRVIYPDVASAVVGWLLAGAPQIEQDWIQSVWERVVYHRPSDTDPRLAVRYA